MSCYHPLKGYRAKRLNENGKRPIVFKAKDGWIDMPVELPCGQCIGCRLDKSRAWAIRCVHESKQYERNSFLTLTYNDENLPEDRNINKSEIQLFMKKLRKKMGKNIRFYACGEYGVACRNCGESRIKCNCGNWVEWLGRPHYHICLFNCEFEDKELFKSRGGYNTYRSEKLEQIWDKGYSIIGDLTFESAAYVARYVTKKMNNKKAEEHYEEVDKRTGEIKYRNPEFALMSRGGKDGKGIGHGWYEEFKNDIYNQDFVLIGGKKMRPPKYYDNKYEIENPNDWHKIRKKRKDLIDIENGDNSFERLRVRENIKTRQSKLLKRGVECEQV